VSRFFTNFESQCQLNLRSFSAGIFTDPLEPPIDNRAPIV
jgi:hypothetical protein